MKNKLDELELKLYKIIKYFFVVCGIVLPIGVIILKVFYKEDIGWLAIIGFPILCFMVVKFISFGIDKKSSGGDDK